MFLAVAVIVSVFTASLFDVHATKIFGLPDVARMTKEDAPAFWRAGVLAINGKAEEAYNPAVFQEPFGENGRGLLYLNPPHFFFMAAPLGVVGYPTAKLALMIMTLAAMAGLACMAGVGAAQRSLFVALLLLSPGAYASALVWQTAPLVALALAAAFLAAPTRPLFAGALLALLTVKPQYGLMAPIFLAATGDWRTIRAAIACTLVLFLLSVAAFGTETWRAFLSALVDVHGPHAARLARDMVAAHQTIAKLGVTDAGVRLVIQATTVAALGAATYAAARCWPRRAAIGFALLASAAASPSLWIYDWPIVAAGVLMLAPPGRTTPLGLQFAASVVWLAPLVPLGLGSMESSVLPMLALLAAATLYFAFFTRQTNSGSLAVTHS